MGNSFAPNGAALRTLPHNDEDLFIAASNAHVLAFDNVSTLPSLMSDTLCRLATGGGFSTRRLYTNEEEALFYAQRPIILNGIPVMVNRHDLAERGLFLALKHIPDERRQTEQEIMIKFSHNAPQFFGALLDAVVVGLRNLPSTKLDRAPRMGDFAVWATACEPAWAAEGRFLSAYAGNRDEMQANVLESDPVASAVTRLDKARWEGTATELLAKLTSMTGAEASLRDWPKTPNKLSNRITRAKTVLRQVGISIEYSRDPGYHRHRRIRITAAHPIEIVPVSSLSSSLSSAAVSQSSRQLPRTIKDDNASAPVPIVLGNGAILIDKDVKDDRDDPVTAPHGSGAIWHGKIE
jgi:hypothetical protein